MNSSPAAPRRNGQRHRRWLPWAAAALLIALIVYGLQPRPAPVEIARAATGTLRATVNEEGKTRIRQRYLVSAPVAGNLRRIPFKAGAEITDAHAVVALIDPLIPPPLDARARSLAEARRDTAAANLERARAQHHFASNDLRRFQQLSESRTVAVQEFETIQWRETSAAKELAAAESALRQVEAELAEFTPAAGSARPAREPIQLKAPICGRVLRVFEESARAVVPGTPLLELGDPSDLEVVIEVLSRDGAAIAPGTKVELEQWGGPRPLDARVRLIEPSAFTKVSALGVEEQRVNCIADIVTPLEQRRGLGDNFRVEARIIVWETANTLKVPAGALFRRGEAWVCFVVEGDRAKLRTVQAGRTSGTETQILDGLKEGESVILYPGDRVHEGQRVTPVSI